MNSVPVFVGLDYHQDSIQLSVVDEAGRELSNRPCSNSWEAVVHRAERYGRVGRAAIESCSGAADLAEELVERAGWSVELAHPGYVNRMKQNPDKPVTAWMLRAEVGRFDRFRNGKQLSRFCGLSPRNASSGNRQADAGLIRAGNNRLRSILIEAAHRLIRYDERWSDFAAKLRTAGKAMCLVVAAVANRWLRWLFHQMQPQPT